MFKRIDELKRGDVVIGQNVNDTMTVAYVRVRGGQAKVTWMGGATTPIMRADDMFHVVN